MDNNIIYIDIYLLKYFFIILNFGRVLTSPCPLQSHDVSLVGKIRQSFHGSTFFNLSQSLNFPQILLKFRSKWPPLNSEQLIFAFAKFYITNVIISASNLVVSVIHKSSTYKINVVSAPLSFWRNNCTSGSQGLLRSRN